MPFPGVLSTSQRPRSKRDDPASETSKNVYRISPSKWNDYIFSCFLKDTFAQVTMPYSFFSMHCKLTAYQNAPYIMFTMLLKPTNEKRFCPSFNQLTQGKLYACKILIP